MIKKLTQPNIPGLNHLPPTDWQFDYENFLNDFIADDFFYAFVMTRDEKIIGTGNIFIKGKVGWLANIIIAEKFRGKGLGFEMTKFLVDFSERKGCETQLLIATDLGEPVYEKVGFEKVTDYLCFDSEVDNPFNYTKSIRELKYSDLKNLYKLDSDANGEDRAHLIGDYYRTGSGYFNNDNELLGFYLPDFECGLVISKDKKAGLELLKLKHSKKGKRTLLPIENQYAIDFLKKNGLKRVVKRTKMILGKRIKWNPKHIFSYGSGYCG